jgi:selenium-binding protein 1
MARWTPDPTFYPSPRLAAKAPAEMLAYVAAFAPKRDVPDAIAVVDVDPSSPTYSKIVGGVDMPQTGDELHHYSRPHTVHCGPDGIYVSALGDAKGDAPGGVFLIDPESFDVLGRWEVERGPQRLAYDFWWHLGYDTVVTSEWGTPNTVENGLMPEILLGAQYGRRLHFWDLQKRKHCRRWISAPITSSCSSFGRRTIQPRPMASSTA